MIKILTIVAMLTTIAAGSLLLYLHFPWVISIERAGEVKKDQGQAVVVRAPPAPTPFVPVPNVLTPMPAATQAPVVEPAPAPPIRKVVKRKSKKSSAAKKLKSKWVVPETKPFSLGDLFNVK